MELSFPNISGVTCTKPCKVVHPQSFCLSPHLTTSRGTTRDMGCNSKAEVGSIPLSYLLHVSTSCSWLHWLALALEGLRGPSPRAMGRPRDSLPQTDWGICPL